MADSKLTALSELSVPALEDLTYIVDDPTGTPVSDKLSMNRLGGLLTRAAMGYRLTTETGVPVSTSDRTSQGTIYLTPDPASQFCKLISLYDGTRWKLYTNAEISLALTATSGKNYDVFVYDNSGTLTLELSAAWTNDTTRADALTTQDGITVKSGATTRRWVGTIRASGANVTEDSLTKRFVINAYNKTPRRLYLSETTTHTYNSSTDRYWNNSSANIVEFLVGSAGDMILAGGHGNGDTQSRIGVVLDWTSGAPAGVQRMYDSTNSIDLHTTYEINPGIGYHYLALTEAAAAGTANLYVAVARGTLWI